MNTCQRCGRMMRPKGAHRNDYPGTITRHSHGLCKPCWTRSRGPLDVAPERIPPPTCVRCTLPCNTGAKIRLCRDCRDVLTEQEIHAWAT